MGILDGVKVIDMGQVVAAPAAGAILADWGAEVIKLEPLSGEIHRGLRKAEGVDTGEINWIIQVYNRNKKGLAIDLKKEAGRDILYELVKRADVFMSNYEISSLQKLDLDYTTLSQLNPKLIYAVISGYGSVGPDKDQRGYDYAAGWARSGMMHLIGETGSLPAAQRPGMIDNVSAAHIVAGICAALLHKEKTGKGQRLEFSIFHCAVWTISMDIQNALAGQVPLRRDRTKIGNPLFNSYRTKDDRWLWLAMLQSDPSWPDFCRAIERPELQNDPRFDTMETRTQNCEELIRIIDEVLNSKTMEEWERRFRECNCIYGRVQTPVEVINDPQALANNFFTEMHHPAAGKIKLVATPAKFHQNPASVRSPAPEIGQHTEEILLDLGYNWEDISRLKEQGIIL